MSDCFKVEWLVFSQIFYYAFMNSWKKVFDECKKERMKRIYSVNTFSKLMLMHLM